MSKAAGLFATAVAEGNLSNAAAQVLSVRDIGADINAALGISVDDVKASDVVIYTPIVDDSSSIRFVSGNTEAVRDGFNLGLEALTESKQRDGIIVSTRFLNAGLLHPYMPVTQATRLDARNYNPSGGTPLYDVSILALATVLAKWQDFSDNGVPGRTITPIITDGADTGSRSTIHDVRKVVGDMLKTEQHIVAFMGIDDGSTDFRAIAREMGIQDQWILTPKNTPSEIRKAFGALSKSAIRASQSAASFSQQAVGGFASP